jgi:hypothetical protein
VAVVPRALLDHVHQDPPQSDVLVLAMAMVSQDVHRAGGSHDSARSLALLRPSRERIGHISVPDLEVTVSILLAVVDRRSVLGSQGAAEPAALDLGHVPYQPEQ